MWKEKPLLLILIFIYGATLVVVIYSLFRDVSSETNPDASVHLVSKPILVWELNINQPIFFSTDPSPFMAQYEGVQAWIDGLHRIEEDSTAKAVFIRMNTPGGSISATQELAAAVQRVKDSGKLVVVSMSEIGASGGYYVAALADYIFANPGTITGSIGVIMAGLEYSRLLEKFSITPNVIKSGKFKDIFSPTRPMTEADKALLQEMNMEAYQDFFQVVQQGREIDAARLRQIADGRILSGRQALKHGLIDMLGDGEEALRFTMEQVGASRDEVQAILEEDNINRLLHYFGIVARAKHPVLPFVARRRNTPLLYMYSGGLYE